MCQVRLFICAKPFTPRSMPRCTVLSVDRERNSMNIRLGQRVHRPRLVKPRSISAVVRLATDNVADERDGLFVIAVQRRCEAHTDLCICLTMRQTSYWQHVS